jgi:hypothetical protein
MKTLFWMLMFESSTFTYAVDSNDNNQLKVDINHQQDGLHMSVSYSIPISACNSFAFITDYENAKNITGVKASRVLSREGNTVLVERQVEERILGFPVQMHSVEKYIEESRKKISFEQIEGEPKTYKGSWTLDSENGVTKFQYEAILEITNFLPKWLIEYYLSHTMRKRFKEMVNLAKEKESNPYLECKPAG